MTEEELRKIVNNNLKKFCDEYQANNKNSLCYGCPLRAGTNCLKNIIINSGFEYVKKWKDIKRNHK